MRIPMTVRALVQGAAALVLLVAAPADAAQTRVWIGVRSGLTFYNEIDNDSLEELATAMSIERYTTSGAQINFDEKGWEIPFGLQLGLRLNDNLNVWGFFHRMPYTLEAPIPSGTFQPPIDTIRLDAPANVFGGGLDFRLGSRGYGSTLLLSFALGTFQTGGGDQDVQRIRNFEIDASGVYWEVSLMAELDFTTELGFYPFIAFQSTSTSETSATLLPRSGVDNTITPPPFDIDYTAVQIGLSVRFRVWPFDVEDDPDQGEFD